MPRFQFLAAGLIASLIGHATAGPLVPGYERLSGAGLLREAGELLLLELGLAMRRIERWFRT